MKRIFFVHNPPTFWERIYLFKMKVKSYFTRYKIVDSKKYRIIPYKNRVFVLSDSETEQAEEFMKENKNIQYIITPTGIGNAIKIKSLYSDECLDITDYKSW